VLPSVTVACANDVCRYAGRQRRVHLRTAAPGVLEMPPLVCAGCGLLVPTVAPWPPINEPEETGMAKVTVHGGPSNAAADDEGGEDVSVGSSSETSSEKPESSPEQNGQPDRSPAPTTASRSGKARTVKSTARSTGGGRTAGTSETDSADEAGE
jgi:hypothetical protein